MAELIEAPDRRWRRLVPTRWELFTGPRPLIAYVLSIDLLLAAIAFIIALRTNFTAMSGLVAALLIACSLLNIEGLRHIGSPIGVFADLHAVWTLPMAFLLPPTYCVLAPLVVGLALQLRVKRSIPYQRLFSACSISLPNAGMALLFRYLVGSDHSFSAIPRADWMHHSTTYALLALVLGLGSAAVNHLTVIIAVKMSDPSIPWRRLLFPRELCLIETVQVCTGVVVTIVVAANVFAVLLVVPFMLLLQRSVLHGQLNAAARLDQKTGLLNAGTWDQEAERAVAAAVRIGRPLALLLIDLDRFKAVNDTYGHLVGDDILRAVAATLMDKSRETDLAGRFGGEEFVLLLPDATPSMAGAVATRLHARVGELSADVLGSAQTMPVQVTVSIGVAQLGRDGCDLMELLASADTALYRAKSAGRNRTCLASESG